MDVSSLDGKQLWYLLLPYSDNYSKVSMNISEYTKLITLGTILPGFEPVTDRQVLKTGLYGWVNNKMPIYCTKMVKPGVISLED